MTSNTLKRFEIERQRAADLEQKRHNLAAEAETHRTNSAKESLTERENFAKYGSIDYPLEGMSKISGDSPQTVLKIASDVFGSILNPITGVIKAFKGGK